MNREIPFKPVAVALFGALLAGGAVGAPADAGGDKRLLRLDLRQLMDVRITAVTKREQPLRESAAAVSVITREEIRRSGVTELPELLRRVPGMSVARVNANKWAVSVRGFNERFADKLLVLVDGRSVYSPIYSGVYWDTLNLPLEDIERIEVVRGPGGTLWGANAVNGVINIITRDARDTHGSLLSVAAGERGGQGTLRHGGRLGRLGGGDLHYRLYAKGDRHGDFVDAAGNDAEDDWAVSRGGFRLDWSARPGGGVSDHLTLQGEIYDGEKHQSSVITPWPATNQWNVVADEDHFDGAHLLAKWRRELPGGREWSLQGWVDHSARDYINHGFEVDTLDLDFQYRLAPMEGGGLTHQFTWGAGYRRVEDRLRDSFTVSFEPNEAQSELWSAFVQDEMRIGERLRLTAGAKFEENDYTGFEWQPSVRFVWLDDGSGDGRGDSGRGTFWGAVTRAVHTPSRADRDMRVNVASVAAVPPFLPQPLLISLFGDPAMEVERMVAYELGWRGEPLRDLSLDATLFYHDYDDLVTAEPMSVVTTSDPAPTHLLLGSRFGNHMRGENYGVELSADWRVTPRWRLSAGYGWLKSNMHLHPGAFDTESEWTAEGTSPEQQLTLRSEYDFTLAELPGRWELDASLGLVEHLDGVNTVGPGGRDITTVEGYARLDLRLGWRPRKGLELSLVGRNLLDDRHPEFSSLDVIPSEVPRTLFGQVTWRF